MRGLVLRTENCPPAIRLQHSNPRTVKAMVVIGADTHKRSHTVAAVEAASGRMLAERTVPAQRRSFEALTFSVQESDGSGGGVRRVR